MITKRTAERLCRAAYDYEDLAARLREAGYDSEANSISEIASRFGNIGRGLMNKIEGKKS